MNAASNTRVPKMSRMSVVLEIHGRQHKTVRDSVMKNAKAWPRVENRILSHKLI